MNFSKEINKIVRESLLNLVNSQRIKLDFLDFGVESLDFDTEVEVSSRKEFGDYTAKVYKIDTRGNVYHPLIGNIPTESGSNFLMEQYDLILSEIRNHPSFERYFKEVNFKIPIFINFFIADGICIEGVKGIDKDFGGSEALKGQKVFVEHTQPNPFKAFHIGHLMNNAIGESVARIVVKNGAEVKTATYHGDVGLHVAKAVWKMVKHFSPGDQSKAVVFPKDFSLGWAYAEGSQAYETDPVAKEEILQINKKLYDIDFDNPYPPFSAEDWYIKGRKRSIEDFERLYKQLGSSFDVHFYESETGRIGKELVLDGKKKGIFLSGISEREDGKEPIVFAGEEFGVHTRVFLNSDGLPTYEAKELGLAYLKRKYWEYSSSITVTANEQDSFFKVVEVAIGKFFPDLEGKMYHLSHGLLKLSSGKMSSRTGNVITAESLIQEVELMVQEKIRERDLTGNEKEEIVRKVAIGAIKYSILKQALGSDIIYNFEKSISFEGDSGPYLQYSYARAQSVLRKAKAERVKASFEVPLPPTALEKLLLQFPDVVEKAGRKYQPHLIALYLTNLCATFNNYYEKNKIVDETDESPYRVALVEKFSIVLKNGLRLLGIEAPEKI